jgi:tetratricopeptide (TPR) repeat protein
MYWEEYPLAIKEEILANPNSHRDLINSLRDSEIDLDGFDMDSIPGYCLIEPLHPGQSLNPVFLAISDPWGTSKEYRRTVCIKLATISPTEIRLLANQTHDSSGAITQEVRVLKELANVPELQGRIPKYIQDGTIMVGQCQVKFLVTEYFFGVRNARPEDFQSLSRVRWLIDLVGSIHNRGIVHGDLTLENLLVARNRRKTNTIENPEDAWRVIDFGSAVRLPKWHLLGESKRPAFAHRLAGALDEIRYATPLNTSYDVACLALLIQEATELQFEDSGVIPKEALACFWKIATDPRPEFRPRNARVFLSELDRLVQPVNQSKRLQIVPWLRASLRRNPKTVALAASMSMAAAFAGSYVFHQRQLNQQAKALNFELSQTLDSLMLRNSSMFRQVTELVVMERIGVRKGKAQIEALIDESLATWGNTKISPKVRITALRLSLDVSDSLLDFDKSDASHAYLVRTLKAIENTSSEIINTDPLVKLIEIRVKSKLVRLAKEYSYPIPNTGSAETVAKEIVEDFLRHDWDRLQPKHVKSSEEVFETSVHREVLLCAENLLRSAIYIFKGFDWPLEDPKVTQRVYEHAIKGIDTAEPRFAIPLAALKCQYGYMFHKGFLNPSWGQVSKYSEFSKKIQMPYLDALALIQGVPESALSDEDSELLRDLRSRIPNNLGMSYTQNREFERASRILQQAWQERKHELDQAPRSLVWLKRSASTAWNLADVYLDEKKATEGLEETRRVQLNRSSLLYRYEAIELYRRLVELDRCSEFEMGYLVNVLRAFYSELDIGNVEGSIELLKQAEKWVELKDPGPFHGYSEDMFLAAALLHTHDPMSTSYRKLYENQTATFREWLLSQQVGQRQDLYLVIRRILNDFLRMRQLEVFSGLASDVHWQNIGELAERLVR